MQFRGSPSWRVDVNGGYVCQLVLFVRQAAGLGSTGDDGIPQLTGMVPDLADRLEADVRSEAGRQWTSWWGNILDLEFRDRQRDTGPARTGAHRRIAARQAICDPPMFASLSDRSALQVAARTTFPGFQPWQSSQHPVGRDSPAASPLDWLVMKQTAEDVAFDRRVSIGDVQARVAVLPVSGVWWQRAAPGAVLCSMSAASDPITAQVLLRDAFESRLMRPT